MGWEIHKREYQLFLEKQNRLGIVRVLSLSFFEGRALKLTGGVKVKSSCEECSGKLKGNMKRKVKKVFACVLAIILVFFVGYKIKQDELTKIVKSCRKCYNECWKLESVHEDTDQRHIIIKFSYRYKNFEDRFLCIKNTQEKLTSTLLDSEEHKWRDYTIQLGFLNVGDYFDVSTNGKQIQIASNMNVSVEAIAKLFPETTELSLAPACYSTIEELCGFEKLERIYFSQGLTEEEKAFVLTIFPQCFIEK